VRKAFWGLDFVAADITTFTQDRIEHMILDTALFVCVSLVKKRRPSDITKQRLTMGNGRSSNGAHIHDVHGWKKSMFLSGMMR
jgi:hypothetical protein